MEAINNPHTHSAYKLTQCLFTARFIPIHPTTNIMEVHGCHTLIACSYKHRVRRLTGETKKTIILKQCIRAQTEQSDAGSSASIFVECVDKG